MNEIRIRLKSLVILISILLFCIVFLFRHSCNQYTTEGTSFLPFNLDSRSRNDDLPTIFAITPTYRRPVQKAELTRLAQTLLLIPNLHWIIVEDDSENSNLIQNLLRRYGLDKRSTLLRATTPSDYKLTGKDPNWTKPRGVEQRNAGLTWLRSHLKSKHNTHSVLYFMDDDNTYSIEVFQQMSLIKPGKVGVWPVGLVGGLLVETPLLNAKNVVHGFNSVWHSDRPFPIDMAGFAISTDLVLKYPDATFNYDVPRGFQESEILRQITTVNDLQPLANSCKEVLVWHTRTEAPNLNAEFKLKKQGKSTNDEFEV